MYKRQKKKSLGVIGKIVGTRKVSVITPPEDNGGWVEVEITSDSGACETVCPQDMCPEIEIVPSIQSERGDDYEVANGETVPNVGEKRCLAMTQGSRLGKKLTFQCADIHKALLSTVCAADAGYDSWYGKTGGMMVHRLVRRFPCTGERTYISSSCGSGLSRVLRKSLLL